MAPNETRKTFTKKLNMVFNNNKKFKIVTKISYKL